MLKKDGAKKIQEPLKISNSYKLIQPALQNEKGQRVKILF
jgi:hypothetical protein